MTDGALPGLRAWVAGEGWQYISDIGRTAAYTHERREALALAVQVAEIQAACYGAELDALQTEDQDDEQ